MTYESPWTALAEAIESSRVSGSQVEFHFPTYSAWCFHCWVKWFEGIPQIGLYDRTNDIEHEDLTAFQAVRRMKGGNI